MANFVLVALIFVCYAFFYYFFVFMVSTAFDFISSSGNGTSKMFFYRLFLFMQILNFVSCNFCLILIFFTLHSVNPVHQANNPMTCALLAQTLSLHDTAIIIFYFGLKCARTKNSLLVIFHRLPK